MKKILNFIFLIAVFTIGFTITSYAENEVLIKTIDNSEAIEIFKNTLPDNSSMLSRNGFGKNSYIGTPFSVEYQEGYYKDSYNPTKSPDGINIYLFYFPVITNGEIVTYVEQTVMENGNVSWAVSKWFDMESSSLNNGDVYALICDKNHNYFAVSDSKTISLYYEPDDSVDYNVPYKDKETKTVNITDPIDIDTSVIIPQTPDEKAIFENAEKDGKVVVLQNADEFGAVNKNDNILVPLRNVTELLGYTVNWDNDTKTINVQKDDTIIKFVIGKSGYRINDKVYFLDTPAEINDGKTLIPLSSLNAVFGIDAAYNDSSQNIIISY